MIKRMTETRPRAEPEPNWEWDLLKAECKDCVIGGYVQLHFLDYEGKRAMCTLCEQTAPITFLPLREVRKILNKKGLSLKQTVFHPSINNYCEKCGNELYDDGKCVTSPCCNAKAIKHFVKKTVVVPNYMFKHEFNKLYSELRHVRIPKEQESS